MESNFKALLHTQCGIVAERVLREMDSHRIFVRSGAEITTDNPILYRWWFPVSAVEKIRDAYKLTTGEDVLEHVEKRQLEDGNMYYALYFGKSNNGSRRFRQHTQRTVFNSTLRQVIYALWLGEQYDESREGEVTAILQQCALDWVEFSIKEEGKFIECMEGICIALGNYPLNLNGNPSISSDWRKYVMQKRKISRK